MSYTSNITEDRVALAINRIVSIANPKRIILFGSYVKGKINRNSDLDILVVTRNPLLSLRKESVRIRFALRDIGMPMDILVVSEELLSQVRLKKEFIYYEALKTGRIVYESNQTE